MSHARRRTAVLEDINRRISARSLVPGDRLPSIRGFAATHRISPSTVAEAYDILVAQGVILARRGSGYFVADKLQPFGVAQTGPLIDREIDPLWVARQSIDLDDTVEKPGCGWLPPDWMPVAALRRATRKIAAAPDGVLTNYGGAMGHDGLRRHIARQLHDQGLDAHPEQVLLTGSGSQALDLICRMLLRPGDTVLVDDPCYFNFQALLRAHQINITSVPFTPAGPDLTAFETVLAEHRPKLYLTNSGLHNPTGASITAPNAHRVLSMAAAHNMIIVEDDIFAEFEQSPAPRLASLDGLDRVLRIGSFSKTLSASLRCGYVAASAHWIAALADLQVATNFGGPSPLVTGVLLNTLSDGGYRKHMGQLHRRLATARRDCIAKLRPMNIRPWITPTGGFYLWCQLPRSVDAAVLARSALGRGLVLAPGDVFSPSQKMTNFMRFNVSQMQDEQSYDILAAAVAEQMD